MSLLDISTLTDWSGPVGFKRSHVSEPTSPKTRGRKGQSTPDPRKARTFDASDRFASDLDALATAIIRGDLDLPVWARPANDTRADIEGSADDVAKRGRQLDQDHALSEQYVSRWGSKPQVVSFDRALGDSVLIEAVAEGDRAKTLDLETRVATVHDAECRALRKVARDQGAKHLPCCCSELVTRAHLQAERTDRKRVEVRDESGRVIERRDVMPMTKGVKVKVGYVPREATVRIDEDTTVTVADPAPLKVVKVTRPSRRLTFTGNGKGTIKEPGRADRAAEYDQAKATRATVTAARTELADKLAALKVVGDSLTWEAWTFEVLRAGRTVRLQAKPADGPAVIGTPARFARELATSR